VGLVGCGHISRQYLATLGRLPSLRLSAVADLDAARAAEVGAALDGVRAGRVDDVIGGDDVDVVLNLTTPGGHADIALRGIAAGKPVYGEKPFTVDTVQARQVLDAAAAAGVRLGCAPDTVLGTGVQTARRLVDDGTIGRPVAATATMITPGHERWHPNPDFYYAPGGGPLMDMGPYYISALVTLLGPVVSVIGAGSRARPERTIGSGPRAGQTVPVLVDTHLTGVLTHAGGALSTLVMSFDAVATRSANIEVHGRDASLIVPDPNYFDGDVFVRALGDDDWRAVPAGGGYAGAARGYGLADMAATPPGREPRASGRLGYHVLDVMESLLASVAGGTSVTLASTCERPPAVAYTTEPPGR
jgi:predicted dehydrogenase